MNYPYRLNEFAIMFFPESCAFFSRPNIITNSLKHYDEEKNILDEIFGTIWMNWISRCIVPESIFLHDAPDDLSP